MPTSAHSEPRALARANVRPEPTPIWIENDDSATCEWVGYVSADHGNVASPLVGGATEPRAESNPGLPGARAVSRTASDRPRPTLAQVILPERARRFWYGTQHVNDVVAVDTDGGNTRHFALQDANHNVVAFATNTTPSTVAQQYNYASYGGLDFIEDGTGNVIAPENLLSPLLFGGMWRDPLTGDYCTPSGRCYDPDTGRWYQRDPNGLGFHMSTIPHYHGMTPMLSPYVSTRGHYADNPNPYGYARFNPNRFTDPMGYFSYMELLTTAGIQAGMGGFINGIVSKFAGGDFYEGFKTGAIGGAFGGGAGFAFAASRVGFIGGYLLKEAAEGFASGASASFYSGSDFKDALVQGVYDATMNVASGGAFSLGARSVKALGIAHALDGAPGGIPKRKNSNLPAFGPGSFRQKLAAHWSLGPDGPAGYDAHHVFPLELADKFRKVGIEPDDVTYGAWWASSDHRSFSKAYELAWEKILNSGPSLEEVLEKAHQLADQFKFKVAF